MEKWCIRLVGFLFLWFRRQELDLYSWCYLGRELFLIVSFRCFWESQAYRICNSGHVRSGQLLIWNSLKPLDDILDELRDFVCPGLATFERLHQVVDAWH